jgi:hypothetical protein
VKLHPWKNRDTLFGKGVGEYLGIENFGELKKTVAEITDGLEIDEECFVKMTALVEGHRKVYKTILTVIRPRVLFLACYYSPVGMAMIRACRGLGIKTVDIQHGKQGKYHGMYTHWTKIPKEGYEFLPDYFWCWGEESKSNIEKWFPHDCIWHRPVVGGNLWLGNWLRRERYEIGVEVKGLSERLREARVKILITLQPRKNVAEVIPSHVIDAMRSAPSDWFWLIRLHQRQMEQKEGLRSIIAREKIKNWELDLSSSLSLPPLLKKVDHHITCWSSVCYEALALGIPTTIVHPTGLRLYEDYIDRGIFYYAESDHTLLSSINKGSLEVGVRESQPYIITDLKAAESALEMILDG